MKYLITYRYQRHGENRGMYGYSIKNSPEEWVEHVEQYSDGEYILINALEISDVKAQLWKTTLTHGM